MSGRRIVALLAILFTLQACGGGGGRNQDDDDDTDVDVDSDTDIIGDGDNLPSATITQQPANRTVIVGAQATFSVVATEATGYQWQRSSDGGATFSAVSGATLADYTTPATSLSDNGARYRVVVSGAANSVTSISATLTVLDPGEFPPDPSTMAPASDPTVPSDVFGSTEFLYTGANPIQTGVAPGTIEARRVAVLRGKVMSPDGSPLPGVSISVLDHQELGQTRSRADGLFDLAVNGGGPLTLRYEKDGLLPAQRAVVAPWRDFAWLPDVVMVGLDPAVTVVTLDSPNLQVARGSVVMDDAGERQATVLIPAGTTATMVLADGSTQPLNSMDLRATEFTVGDRGPLAMPATLPATSGYTYAAELSVDQAIAAGATDVQFDTPLPVYVENFLGFEVGSVVPSGYYDRERGEWIASENGLVIEVLDVMSGTAVIDIDGDGIGDMGAELTELGVTSEELFRLATLYAAGTQLWRVPVTHFTPWDFNWPWGPPLGARPPSMGKPRNPRLRKLTKKCGSIIGCENQSLGESVPVAGTPFTLNYQSDRSPANQEGLRIPLTDSSVPPNLRGVSLEVTVAGKRITAGYPAAPNLTHTLAWDGTDAYGRTLHSTQTASVRIGYTYEAVYLSAGRREQIAATAQSFGHYTYDGAPATAASVGERLEITLWQEYVAQVERWDSRAQGLGGWHLDVHHAYSPLSRTLLMGDGSQRHAESLSSVISTIAGTGTAGFTGDNGPATAARLREPADVALAPDGTVYIADRGNRVVRRVAPNGVITTVAGTGDDSISGDGGQATQASIGVLDTVAVALDGSLLIGSENRIRRVGADGVITTIAGNGGTSFSGPGAQATSTSFSRIFDIAVGPDGSLYIACGFEDQVYRVGTDGRVTVVAGIWNFSSHTGDGGLGSAAGVQQPEGVGVGPDGSVYMVDVANARVRGVTPNGIITTVVGNGVYGAAGDGGQAKLANLSRPAAINIAPDGGMYIADDDLYTIRYVGSDGVITTIAGTPGTSGLANHGNGGPATAARLSITSGMAVGADGVLYLADSDNDVIRRIAPLFPSFALSDTLIASEDGTELYVFDSSFRHKRTVDALTGALRYLFTYDSAGYLTSITDGSGNVTTIERSGADATAIVGAGGHRTDLVVANGWLEGITDPAGGSYAMSYSPQGIMVSFTDPRDNVHDFTYDSVGRLVLDEDPEGGSTTLSRTGITDDYTVTLTTELGRVTTYRVELLAAGGMRRTTTSPSGAVTVMVLATNGSEQTTYPDGSTLTLTMGPDPRWGMMAPIPSRVVMRSPAGIQRTVIMTRTATLSDPGDLLSLTNLTGTYSDNGRVSTLVYDATSAPRTLTLTTPLGRSAAITIDGLGRVDGWQTPGIDPKSYTYDGDGLLTAVTQGGRGTTLAYDTALERIGVTDALGRTVGFSHDAAARVIGQTLPGGRTASYGYDASGNPTSFTPPERTAHGFGYDANDLIASYTPPTIGAPATVYTYDDDRKLTNMSMPDGRNVVVTYDPEGRVDGVSLARGLMTFAYDDLKNQLTGATAPGSLGLTYTRDGPLLTGVSWSGAVAASVSYTYNSDMRINAERVNGGSLVSFGYDDDGFLTTAGNMTLAFDPQNGLLTGTTLGSVVDTSTYNAYGELASYVAAYDGTPIYGATYTRDDFGRITQIVETIEGVSATWVYGYNPAGRLISVTKDAAAFSTHAYDGNGNRITSNGVSSTVDAQDRLSSMGTTTYAYNASGQRSSKTIGVSTTTYTYDELGNLVQVVLPNGDDIDYLIDAEGRRIGRSVNGTLQQGFVYQGALRPSAELDGSGSIVSRFVYATHANVPDYVTQLGVAYRIITDHLGSPRLVVHANTGAVVQRLDYDDLGRVTNDTSPGFQPFGFAGGLHDTATGLTRFGARDYDAAAGRWTAKDPSNFAGGDSNLYGYAYGDPVNFNDPEGLACKPLYVKAHDTKAFDKPDLMAWDFQRLRLGDQVNFKGFDPSGKFAIVDVLLPNGTTAEGYVLPETLSTQPPSFNFPDLNVGPGMSNQAFPSHGVGIKG